MLRPPLHGEAAAFYFANQGKTAFLGKTPVLPHMAPLERIMKLSVEDLTVDCNKLVHLCFDDISIKKLGQL